MADNLKLDRAAMKDRATSHLRIYVGGLTEYATVQELYDHFQAYGQIDGIVINRGFGFVQFEDEASAQKAIEQANGSVFQGKSINVRTTQTNADKARREQEMATQQDMSPAPGQMDEIPVDNSGEDNNYDSFGNYIGDKVEEDSESSRGKVRGPRVRSRGRNRGTGGPRLGKDRSPIGGRAEWDNRSGYDRYQQPPPEYPRALPVPERNDCEIIVVSKTLTEYAEYIESRLKRLGIVVDLLYPMEDVPIGKVLGNIASRGCLYAILVTPQNQEYRSLTLTILHGLPQEHRNMPIEDALQLMSRNFQEVQRGGPTGREAVYALLGQLADGNTLTVSQYDKVIEYLQERRGQQVKLELGEPLTSAAGSSKAQVDLQQRILNILNEKTTPLPPKETAPPPAPAPAPAPIPPPTQSKLLNDPTVRKALDSILQNFV